MRSLYSHLAMRWAALLVHERGVEAYALQILKMLVDAAARVALAGDPRSAALAAHDRAPAGASSAHRRRAWELRGAQDRAERPVSDGRQSRVPVGEIVERTQTVVRTVVLLDQDKVPLAPRAAQRLNGEPYTLPEDAVEWIEALVALRREVGR
ncbi:hypothetical protein ACFYZ2_32260 [Streptomyces sviceus]|uniref:hypothetical protein n=1 Tax=Streptomyces sviceus TaxID=285530 RepID=UPI0036CAB23A